MQRKHENFTFFAALCLFITLFGAISAFPSPAEEEEGKLEGTIAVFTLEAEASESASDVRLLERLLFIALEQAVAQGSRLEVIFVNEDTPSIVRLVEEGVIAAESLQPPLLKDIAALVGRQLDCKAAIIPRLQRAEALRDHGVYELVLSIILTQSGRSQDFPLPYKAKPAAVETTTGFNAALPRLTQLLQSNILPELSAFIATDKPGDPAEAQRLFELAQASYSSKRYDEAVEYLNRAILYDSTVVEYYLLLGDVYVEKRELSQAAAEYQRAVYRAPKLLEARKKYADCLIDLERLPEARQQLIVAHRLAPEDIYVIITLSRLYLRDGDERSAALLLENAVIKNKEPALYVQLGDIYSSLGRGDLAAKNYQQALALGGNKPLIFEKLARLYIDEQKYAAAFHYLARAAALWDGKKSFSTEETKDTLEMVEFSLIKLLLDSRALLIEFSEGKISRVEVFEQLSIMHQQAKDTSTLLQHILPPHSFTDIVSRWETIASLVGQALFDHLVHIDTNDTSYNLIANQLRNEINQEINAVREEMIEIS